MADQARDLPDAGEPELRQHVRQVPGRQRHDDRAEGREGAAADPVPGVAARRPPPRPGGLSELRERREVRPFRHGHVRGRLRLHPVRSGSGPELLRMGRRLRPVRQLLLLRRRPLLPEPLLLHRGTIGRNPRQSREHQDRGREREEAQELGVRRVRGRRVRVRQGRQGQPHEAPILFRLPHRATATLAGRR